VFTSPIKRGTLEATVTIRYFVNSGGLFPQYGRSKLAVVYSIIPNWEIPIDERRLYRGNKIILSTQDVLDSEDSIIIIAYQSHYPRDNMNGHWNGFYDNKAYIGELADFYMKPGEVFMSTYRSLDLYDPFETRKEVNAPRELIDEILLIPKYTDVVTFEGGGGLINDGVAANDPRIFELMNWGEMKSQLERQGIDQARMNIQLEEDDIDIGIPYPKYHCVVTQPYPEVTVPTFRIPVKMVNSRLLEFNNMLLQQVVVHIAIFQ
jgi:hypothetical protein